ncbi:MAG TPA: BTAD domain-containing putative transcriptional regulator [Solirubrobacteraceae bacterium]|nr:BTAD domain-containing putative transcriptional regulator [Solirubrobacteraceae bacterium]
MESGEVRGLGIQLLGTFAVRVDGAPVPEDAWRLRRARTLVKLLALAPERRLHREVVVELLWPDGDGKGLHQVLYTARRALGGERLVLREGVVALEGDVVVDADAFERAAATAREERTRECYRAALDLYGGELLPEDRYEEWTAARRESLRETQARLAVELAEVEAAGGDTAAAIGTLQRVVADDPLHEVAHRALMRLFAADGRGQQALAQYEQLREALRRELGADPDPETRALYRELLAGQHEAEPGRPSRLPHQLTMFVGRERELAELEQLLGRTRLLTLTGPGGAGKTRLSLELAARLPDDVRVVELAPVADPAFVVEETAAALGVQPRSDRDAIEVLASQIGEQRLVIVLDNCEHVIDACARLADRLLRDCPNLRMLATSRERLRIDGEVAWRVPSLTLPDPAAAERSEAVRLFCLRAADAAPGFALDAGNVEPVAEICRRLDGMPLALELAAARAAVLSPQQIAERLGDSLTLLQAGSRAGLTRQQTLRATLQWSHDLLSEPERTLYRRLGVFAGTFPVEAVEGICGERETIDLLARLVEKSLVQVEATPDGHRYRLLETVRQDARERLAAAGEAAQMGAAHRAWYLAIAEAADRDRDPTVAPDWPATRLEPEHDDVRAALASAIRHDPPAALRLANGIWWCWMARGYFAEGARWLQEALAAAPDRTPERARALHSLAAIEIRRRRREVTTSVPLAEEALEIVRGDPQGEARALERMAVLALAAFEWDVSDRAFAEGLALAEDVGDERIVVAIKQGQGVLACCRGETAHARELLEESLRLLAAIPDDRGPLFWATRISPAVVPAGPGGTPRSFFEDTFCLFRAVRSRAGQGYVHCNIAETWRAEGEYAAARAALARAAAIFRELDDGPGLGVALNALGNLSRSAGDVETGREAFAEALALRRAARDSREIATTLLGLAMLARSDADRTEADRRFEEAHAIFERTDDGPGLQLAPLSMAAFELDDGDPWRAVELLERCIELSIDQGLDRHWGWAAAELGEAAMAVGDLDRARETLDDALAVFARARDGRGSRYAQGLRARLGALSTAD